MTGIICSMVGASFATGSRSAKTITAVGNAQVSTAQSVFGGASALFDGTTDYLNVTGFSSTSTFTFESRIRFIALPTAGNFMMLVGTSSSQYFALANIGGTYFWEVSVITSGQAQYVHRWTSTGIATNTWFHIAVQKTGTTVSCYQDGTSRSTSTSFNTLTSAMTLIDSSTFLGSWSNTGYTVNGYMDEIRYSDIVRYSSNFTTPTTPFSNDTSTLLLIHADGTNGSTTFTDDVTSPTRPARTLTAVGNAQVSTAQSVFGGSSAFFDGAGDYITVSSESSDFGTGDFTIEGRIRFATVSGVRVFYDRRQTGAGIPTPNGILLYWDGSTFVYHGNGATRISGGTASINTWYHWAVSRSSGSTRMFINGTQVGSTFTDSQNYNVAETNYIGASVSLDATWFNGWIDEVRVSNIARYTANFTTPTTPFSNDTSTLLLIHADGANASTTFVDDVGTTAGVTYRTDSYASFLKLAVPFDNDFGTTDIAHRISGTGLTTSATKTQGANVSLVTAQVKWTSSPNYVKSADFAPGAAAMVYTLPESLPSAASGTWVIEGWFRPEGTTGFKWTISSNDVGGRFLFSMYALAEQQLTTSEGNQNFLYLGTPSAWVHVAIVCDGGTKRVYQNAKFRGNWLGGSSGFTALQIGQQNNTDANDYDGQIQDLRVYIGTNKGYTGTNTTVANFTVPSSIIESY